MGLSLRRYLEIMPDLSWSLRDLTINQPDIYCFPRIGLARISLHVIPSPTLSLQHKANKWPPLPTQWTVEILKFQTAETHSYRAFWRKIISACLSIKFAVRVSALIDHYLSCFDIATIDWALIRRQLKIKSLKWSGNKTIFIRNKSLGKLVSSDITAIAPQVDRAGISDGENIVLQI